eukprot:7174339-Pyramimonas_sp.AAC.1
MSEVWGAGGAGRSSTAAAFEHNLHAEMASLLGRYIATAAVDAWKCYESISPCEVLNETRHHGFPLRLVWMVLEYHRQPLALEAFTSHAEPFVSWSRLLAGCPHSTSLLTLLTLRAVRRARLRDVVPRALVDDLAIQ